MNLLDRHIFKSVLFSCVAAVALFTFVLTFGNVVRDLLTHALAGQFPATTVIRLVSLWIPSMAIYSLPMGILTGVLLTLGRLSADSEITAMRAAGISVARIARPIFLLGIAGALGALYVNFVSMPWARVQYEKEKAAALRASPESFIVPKTFIRDFRGCVVYVGEKEGLVLRDIWFWRLDDQRRVTSFDRAETGRIEFDEESNTLRLTLTKARVETRDEDQPENFAKNPILFQVDILHPQPIPMDRYLGQSRTRMKQEWLTYPQLRAEQARLAATSPPPEKAREHMLERLKFELIVQDKFNLSLAVFSFALIGVPLGIKVSRRETSANLTVALVLVLSYYMLTIMVKWLDRHPEYRPDLLIWLPNVLFVGLGVWLFRRIDKR